MEREESRLEQDTIVPLVRETITPLDAWLVEIGDFLRWYSVLKMPLRGYWRGPTLAPYIRESVSEWSSTAEPDKEYLLSQILDEIKPMMKKKMLAAEPDKLQQTIGVLKRMGEFAIWKTATTSLYDNGFVPIGKEYTNASAGEKALENRYVKVRE